MRMLSEFFLGVTTIGAHHSVASVISVTMFCLCNNSSSALSLSRYMNGIERGVFTQKGLALSVSEIWNSSPVMVLICPSKTLGNSFMMLSSVGGSRIDKVLVCSVVWLMLCCLGVMGLG